MAPCVCTHTHTHTHAHTHTHTHTHAHTHTHTPQELTGLEQELMEFRSCVESIGTNLDNSENRDNARRLRILIKKRIRDASGKLKLRHKGSVRRKGAREGGSDQEREGGKGRYERKGFCLYNKISEALSFAMLSFSFSSFLSFIRTFFPSISLPPSLFTSLLSLSFLPHLPSSLSSSIIPLSPTPVSHRSPQQSIEAQQLSKKLASFIQQFEDILSQEKQVTRQRSITNQCKPQHTRDACVYNTLGMNICVQYIRYGYVYTIH